MIELIRNAELYAPEPKGRTDILVAAGRIVWTGRDAPPLPGPYGVIERDLGGRRVLPGLVDAHVHVTGGGGEAGPDSRVAPPPLSEFTRAGVTSVVGLLGTDDVTRSTAELLACTRALAAAGLSAWCHTGGYHLPPATLTGSVRGDIVHVERIIGAGEIAISDHRSSQPTLDELLRIASESHIAGLMTGKAGIIHLHTGAGARGLSMVRAALESSELPPRVFNPTHVNRSRSLLDQAFELAERGCTIDVTAYPGDESGRHVPAGEALNRYLESALPLDRITVSSDAGGSLPRFDRDGRVVAMEVGQSGSLPAALRGMLSQGMRLEAVLPAFTSNVARLLRLERKGRVAAGADADLVVLDERDGISDVMASGQWHVIAGIPVVRGRLEVT